MLKRLLQILAFFFPAPINVWILRLAGARIGKYVSIHPGVLILANSTEIGSGARIKFGTMINVRTFRLGRKSSIGFFTLVKGESDLLIGDASIIGPRTLINCSREVTIGYYSGVGPGSYLYTHGSGQPVTEGYRATFAPIHIEDKVWVSMRVTIGPGVTIGTGSNIMSGTVLAESIGSKRLVAGDPAKMNNIPVFLVPRKPDFIKKLASEILHGFCNGSKGHKRTNFVLVDGILRINGNRKVKTIAVDGDGDIVLLTTNGSTREGMYFNLANLTTDSSRNRVKLELEAYMRLYYGLIFLEK